METHALLKRVNPHGVEGLWQCPDCGRRGTIKEMSKTPCDGVKKSSFEEALFAALDIKEAR